jgi:hypothetical protein
VSARVHLVVKKNFIHYRVSSIHRVPGKIHGNISNLCPIPIKLDAYRQHEPFVSCFFLYSCCCWVYPRKTHTRSVPTAAAAVAFDKKAPQLQWVVAECIRLRRWLGAPFSDYQPQRVAKSIRTFIIIFVSVLLLFFPPPPFERISILKLLLEKSVTTTLACVSSGTWHD